MRAILEQKSDQLPIDISEIREHFALCENDSDIAKLLQNAIEHVELQSGLSLQKKTWKIIHDNPYIMLGFGPIIKVLSICDGENQKIEPVSMKRVRDNLILQFAQDGVFKIRYEAGYDKDTLPACLKSTVLEKFWDLYSQSLYENCEQGSSQEIGCNLDQYYVLEKKKVNNDKYYFKF